MTRLVCPAWVASLVLIAASASGDEGQDVPVECFLHDTSGAEHRVLDPRCGPRLSGGSRFRTFPVPGGAVPFEDIREIEVLKLEIGHRARVHRWSGEHTDFVERVEDEPDGLILAGRPLSQISRVRFVGGLSRARRCLREAQAALEEEVARRPRSAPLGEAAAAVSSALGSLSRVR